MKVAYVIPHIAHPCGWRTFTIGAINALREYVQPILIVSKEDYSTTADLFPGIDIIALPVTQGASFGNVGGASRLFATLIQAYTRMLPAFDLVHSLEAYPSGLVGDWLAHRRRCPHVITAHGTYALIWKHSQLDNIVYRGVLARARLICPVSHGTAYMMKKLFGKSLKHDSIKPIYNGNDFYKRVSHEEVFARKFPRQPIFLSVGEVKPRKGQLSSLQAFIKVCQRYPQAQYWIIGDWRKNAYTTRMREIIAEHQLTGVKILGRIGEDELSACLAKATALILTPEPQSGAQDLHIEGFGLVYLEAGAFGLPVIGTRFGGVPDAVKDGETGILVEPADIGAIAEAMLQLIENPSKARQMGQANRLWAETLTWERYALEQFQAYQEIID